MNNHLISEAREYSRSYSTNHNCITRHMAAPQLILQWQRLVCHWNDEQWQLLVPKGKMKTYCHQTSAHSTCGSYCKYEYGAVMGEMD